MADKSSVPMLKSYNDIFSNVSNETNGLAPTEIKITDLHSFKNHPFRVEDDLAMESLVESVKHDGVYTPGLARPLVSGGFELLSGHRRKRACELAGLATMPVIVRDMDDDTAAIIMVDSNFQHRETLLPSEKAFAYRIKYEAMKRQRRETPQDDSPAEMRSDQAVAEDVGDSRAQIQRYIRLTYLVPELLVMVDDKKINLAVGYDLSFLSENEQTELACLIDQCGSYPTSSQAERLKQLSGAGKLTYSVIDAVMSEEQATVVGKVVLKGESIKKYFPSSYTAVQMQDTIVELLEKWAQSKQGGD